MSFLIDPAVHMWVVLVLTLFAVVSYAAERISLEATSLILLTCLLVFFQVFPLPDAEGRNLLGSTQLLQGFANPSLIAVMALLVLGQGLVQTEALNGVTGLLLRMSRRRAVIGLAIASMLVLGISAILNNTPVVILFIPIMQALAGRLQRSVSSVMMPLSFAAILGGMTTLIGSSTNLLVSSALTDLGFPPLTFFEFTPIGLPLALIGFLYVVGVLPFLLPDRATLAGVLFGQGKQFIAEIDVLPGSPLVGQRPVAGYFPQLPDMTVRQVQRGVTSFLPPFENLTVEPGDILIVAATRQTLTEALARNKGYLLSPEQREEDSTRRQAERVLTEVMVAPASRMVDQTIEQIGFHRRFGCHVLGIQRRARMVRRRLTEIRLQAGDVLLILGDRENVERLRDEHDVVLLAWSMRELPRTEKAITAALIFAGVVATAATGLVPITVAAVTGAVLMLLTRCLNQRQAARALDRTIFLLVGAALALGSALEHTGAAAFVAQQILSTVSSADPVTVMAVLFIIVAATTNLLTNNACAILFTPIGINLARTIGVDPHVMAITVLIAANCSFATPIGYQTNLLVMGPGHYRFADFLRGGLPLVVLIWVAYVVIASRYFGL